MAIEYVLQMKSPLYTSIDDTVNYGSAVLSRRLRYLICSSRRLRVQRAHTIMKYQHYSNPTQHKLRDVSIGCGP